jgi:L-seryl-tRNA(Ser) seleniumtransferase
MPGDSGDLNERLRRLPAVDRVLAALDDSPSPIVTAAARRAVEDARARVRAGADAPGLDDVLAAARRLVDTHRRVLLRPVINATGVLIHTNLGRIPLGDAQRAAVERISGTYSNLEYDLDAGGRGSRYAHARSLLTALTGAESALVVNNNAAAVLLVLSALCKEREVLISRGELIEIGGEFRMPDVMAQSGARLVEVGTTNRTHLGDYERAITPDTAAILKVHPSNYRITGFSIAPHQREIARLARGRGLLFLYDLGSGLIAAPDGVPWVQTEPSVGEALADADLVMFSGDKLLGGPQAGVILGRTGLIDRLSAHPLARPLRVDKMTLAALEATVEAYLEGRAEELPLWQMLLAPAEELRGRAEKLAQRIKGATDEAVKVEAIAVGAVTGGGSLPGTEMSSWALAVTHAERSADAIEHALRRRDPPIIARIEDDRVLLDLRTVPGGADEPLAASLCDALRDDPSQP